MPTQESNPASGPKEAAEHVAAANQLLKVLQAKIGRYALSAGLNHVC
jgi:hypothetical protein